MVFWDLDLFGFRLGLRLLLVAKLAIIMGAHSEWKWDKALYEIPLLHPVMWLLERVISTASTHSGHHGLRKDDPATN